MTRKKAASHNDLRKRAEEKLEKKSSAGPEERNLSSRDAKKLIHELQVHQIELEVQNEELRKAQEDLVLSQRRYADLFNFAPLGYVVLDLEGVVREANSTAVGMLGTAKRILEGRPLSLHVNTPDRMIFSGHMRQAFTEPKGSTCVVRMKTARGAFFYAQLDSKRIEEEEQGGPACLTAITDISKLKALEKEKETNISDLEAFGHTASHELRSPLVSIGGMARIISEDYAGCLDGAARHYLEIILGSAKRMELLLTDILEFSKLGAKEVASSAVDAGALARSAWEEVSSEAGKRHVKVDIGSLPAAKGDAAMIRQVFVNLMSNALKFTNGTRDVRIEIRGQKGEGENIYSVRDNGVGFSMEYAYKLFNIFQRLHSAKEYPGTGAGLSIVKRIVEKHGGRVWAKGKTGEGATFYFTLPAA